MGIEFIRNASGKPYTKRWARGIDRIKAPTLMDVSISEPHAHREADREGSRMSGRHGAGSVEGVGAGRVRRPSAGG
jgi:hypothetical protein